MKFINVLKEIEKTDHGAYEQLTDRRSALKNFSAKVAVAALPLALGSAFTKASAKTTSSLTDALNFALWFKYFEYNYFHVGVNAPALIPSADLPGFKTIESQELAHINYLRDTIVSLGGTAYVPPNYDPLSTNPAYIPSGTYDFTAGGAHPVFSNYITFLVYAQVFEDVGVRGMKGLISAFLGNATLLTQIMQVQCTEARHAAHVRLIRRFVTPTQPEYPAPWISNNIPPLTALQAYYLGEDNASQQGVVISDLPGVSGNIPLASATAGFDEPLDQAKIKSLLVPFFV